MQYSVHDLPKRLDLFNKDDWTQCIDANYVGGHGLAAARDPLHWFGRGIEIYAVWGFNIARREIRIMLGDPVAPYEAYACRFADRRRRLQLYTLLAPRLAMLAAYRPQLEQVLRVVTNDLRPDAFPARLHEELEFLSGEKFILDWNEGKELTMVALVDSGVRWKKTEGRPPLQVGGNRLQFDIAMGRLYDYYFNKQKLLNFVPSGLFSCREENVDNLLKVFSDPLAFDPRQNVPADAFLWPWQRSIGFRGTLAERGESFYKPIVTTSLVLDIRASTTAMDLSSDSAAFAEFIDRIVETSRRIIVEHGGFFDKETGDGVVGHFCHATSAAILSGQSNSERRTSVPHQATEAAIQMSKEVKALCRDYQSILIHGLDGLGPAIGIHTATAVWLADGSQVRAIGPAVVGAARLCAQAEVSEVLLSNHSFQQYAKFVAPNRVSQFEKKSIAVKEYNQNLGIYCYALRLRDSI